MATSTDTVLADTRILVYAVFLAMQQHAAGQALGGSYARGNATDRVDQTVREQSPPERRGGGRRRRVDPGVRIQAVDDTLYCSVRPMLAVSQGTLVALSTPFGKRGWFHDEWHGENDWHRVKVRAEQCPRISPQFLAEERRALGERWFNQEYRCEFSECLDAVFSWADIQAAMSDDIKPLILE
jgi:hypothetical protein